MHLALSKTWTLAFVGVGLAVASWSCAVFAQEGQPREQTENLSADKPSGQGGDVSQTDNRVVGDAKRRYALIVVGIPGDQEHQQKFEQTLGIWRRWLMEVAGVEGENINVLSSDNESDDARPATAASIAEALEQFQNLLTPDDSLWVFLLGHGSQDKRHGWFHLPCADLNSAQWAGLFAELPAEEQVFWLTHAGSGSFLKPMSLPNRIVITATDADGEVNETHFPHALAEVMQGQIDDNEQASKPASVLSLFQAASERVNQIFERDRLVPTEHAQLDDNGDGVGTEITDLDFESTDQIDAAVSVIDGGLASRVTIELQPTAESKAAKPASQSLPSSPAKQNP